MGQDCVKRREVGIQGGEVRDVDGWFWCSWVSAEDSTFEEAVDVLDSSCYRRS